MQKNEKQSQEDIYNELTSEIVGSDNSFLTNHFLNAIHDRNLTVAHLGLAIETNNEAIANNIVSRLPLDKFKALPELMENIRDVVPLSNRINSRLPEGNKKSTDELVVAVDEVKMLADRINQKAIDRFPPAALANVDSTVDKGAKIVGKSLGTEDKGKEK